MQIAYVYARPDGTIPQVWDTSYGAPAANTTLISRFDFDTYRAIYFALADNVKAIRYEGGAIVLGAEVIVSAAWIADRELEIVTASNVTTAKSGLKDKIALARDHADAIKRIFNTVLDQTIDQTTQPTRWNNIKEQIDHASTANAFKVRFAKDVLEELGFDANGVLSAAQIRQITLYTRMWITSLALLLSEA